MCLWRLFTHCFSRSDRGSDDFYTPPAAARGAVSVVREAPFVREAPVVREVPYVREALVVREAPKRPTETVSAITLAEIPTPPATADPRFPLRQAPQCRTCSTSGTRRLTQEDNPNGNIRRPYYFCTECKRTQTDVPESKRGWITWDDARGINQANPHCYCLMASRQDRCGSGSSSPGMGFWTCATGTCGYFSKDRYGLTRRKLDGRQPTTFRPWLV
ncbi:hypothetical protein AOQ84DRAFT_393359 [Glonium stellatum]|uniref:GRF-like zinc ribbon domain-containing protein n=1 Tax=Glonium stellatum TaxID=574774 RepID=A0A8E2JM83_9PEZI|nr:hypothetical protein AOQ84DRAFT_393359 [Glonium stellatum]